MLIVSLPIHFPLFGISMKKLLLLLCIALLWTSCSGKNDQPPHDASAHEQQEDTTPLHDGLYVVLAATENSADTSRKPGREIRYASAFSDPTTQTTRLWVDTKQYVLLQLASAPDSIGQPDRRTDILLTLTDKASAELASFTEQRLSRQVVLIVGGQAVTMYTIQSKIDDGIILVPRCTNDACDYLYTELKDNVNSEPHKQQEHDDMEHHLLPPMIPVR